MNRNDYSDLVKNWNRFLYQEENLIILESSLVEKNLINENFIKNLRKKGIKNSVILPILLMKTLSLGNVAQGAPLPSYSDVKDAANNARLMEPTHDDYKNACDTVNRLEILTHDDLKDRDLFDRLFNSADKEDIESLFNKTFEKGVQNASSIEVTNKFPGIYTKMTALCLPPETKNNVTKNIYKAISKITKNKLKKLLKVPVPGSFDLFIGEMDSSKYNEYAKIIVNVYFEDNIRFLNPDSSENLEIKQQFLKETVKSVYKRLENSKAVGLTFPYHFFTKLLDDTLQNSLKKGDLKGITISFSKENNDNYGGLILLKASANEHVIEHELGHALSVNIDDFRENPNNFYYKFVKSFANKKSKDFTKKYVVDFLLSMSGIPIEDFNSLSERGQNKIISNASLLINMFIGSGAIKQTENDKFKMLVTSKYWDVYLHSFEERIETLHSILEDNKLKSKSAIDLLEKVKIIIKKGNMTYKGKTQSIGTYSELQHEISKKLNIDRALIQSIFEFFGHANMSYKSYNPEYAEGQINNMIKLINANF